MKNNTNNNNNGDLKETNEEEIKSLEEDMVNKLKLSKNTNFSNKRSFTPIKNPKKFSGLSSASSKGVFNLSSSLSIATKVSNPKSFGDSSNKNKEITKKTKISDKNLILTSINGTSLNNINLKKKK